MLAFERRIRAAEVAPYLNKICEAAKASNERVSNNTVVPSGCARRSELDTCVRGRMFVHSSCFLSFMLRYTTIR